MYGQLSARGVAELEEELAWTRRLLGAVIKVSGQTDSEGNPSVDVPDAVLAGLEDREALLTYPVAGAGATRVCVLKGMLVRE